MLKLERVSFYVVRATIGNREKTLFWRDRWLGGQRIVDFAPNKSNMVRLPPVSTTKHLYLFYFCGWRHLWTVLCCTYPSLFMACTFHVSWPRPGPYMFPLMQNLVGFHMLQRSRFKTYMYVSSYLATMWIIIGFAYETNHCVCSMWFAGFVFGRSCLHALPDNNVINQFYDGYRDPSSYKI